MPQFKRLGNVYHAQLMLPMRDGTRLNTFIYLPALSDPKSQAFPVIIQRTPYGITAPDCDDLFDAARGWLPSAEQPLRGSILRGWRAIVARGYAVVYQDTRGRFGSEGEDQVYCSDADDGADTIAWVAEQAWCNHHIGLSGSSAGATTALAGAASGHASVKAFFAQVGGASIYDDVVYEGQSIEMERLWLWVAKNLPGLSNSHRQIASALAGRESSAWAEEADAAQASYERLLRACDQDPPFVSDPDWMRLPLSRYPHYSVCQPFLDELLSHPTPDEFRAKHNFKASINIPGFHATTWYDIFATSVIKAFQEISRRAANQRLWIGPNDHYYIYEQEFWPRDPYFEWFDYWLKGIPAAIVNEPPVYFATQAWVASTDEPSRNQAPSAPWRHADEWPPNEAETKLLYLRDNGALSDSPGGDGLSFVYDPRQPIPTRGGRNMAIAPGPLDQRPNETLPGYGLIYCTAPLTRDLTLLGDAAVELHVESDCPDTDFVARLIELRPDGEARLLMDGVVRVMLREPDKGSQPLSPNEIVAIQIELGHLCHTIESGCQIRLDIGSSNFPRRARNTNSGNLRLADDDESAIRVAVNTVHHSSAQPSRLELRVAPQALADL